MQAERISRLSARMAHITLIAIVMMLVLNVGSWYNSTLFSLLTNWTGHFSWTASFMLNEHIDPLQLPWWQQSIGAALSSVPFLVLSSALWHLRKLFLQYANGILFSASTAFHMRKVGQNIALWVGIGIIFQPIMSVWLTFTGTPGERSVMIGVTVNDFVLLYMAGCICVIAHVMSQAKELAEEHRQFI